MKQTTHEHVGEQTTQHHVGAAVEEEKSGHYQVKEWRLLSDNEDDEEADNASNASPNGGKRSIKTVDPVCTELKKVALTDGHSITYEHRTQISGLGLRELRSLARAVYLRWHKLAVA